MKRLITILLTLISIATMAQTQLFRGKSSYSGDILYSVNGVMPIPALIVMIQ